MAAGTGARTRTYYFGTHGGARYDDSKRFHET